MSRQGGIVNKIKCLVQGHEYKVLGTYTDYGDEQDRLELNRPQYKWYDRECIHCGKRNSIRGLEVR